MEVVYESPGVIRCIGPNGVDDGGTFDDWEFSIAQSTGEITETGPNWRHWYVSEWNAVRFRACLRAILILFIGVAVRSTFRRMSFVIASVTISYGILFLNISEAEIAVLYWPSWIQLTESLAAVALGLNVVAGMLWGMRMLARLGKQAVRQQTRNDCDQCGYDLTGLLSNVCPECGGAIRTQPRLGQAGTEYEAESNM
jgi:predicted RNA-binding Zn-ribbon protein involved in translation (DUF1610 family)